eukprot:1140769-Pelagomonas_calceolata.AAC.10
MENMCCSDVPIPRSALTVKKKKKQHRHCLAEKTLPTSIKEKETHWLRRVVSPLHHDATKKKKLMGIWRVIGSTRLHNLAARSILVFNSAPSVSKPLV